MKAKVTVVDPYLSGRICCLSCVLGIADLVASLGTAGGDTTAIEKARSGLSTANVRRILRDLRDHNFIVVIGGVGRPTTYRRATE